MVSAYRKFFQSILALEPYTSNMYHIIKHPLIWFHPHAPLTLCQHQWLSEDIIRQFFYHITGLRTSDLLDFTIITILQTEMKCGVFGQFVMNIRSCKQCIFLRISLDSSNTQMLMKLNWGKHSHAMCTYTSIWHLVPQSCHSSHYSPGPAFI